MLIEKNVPQSSGLSKRKEAFVRGLAHKSVRNHRGSFVAEGVRVVEEALAGRWRVTDIVGTPSTAGDIERWRAEGRLDGVAVAITDDRTFQTLADSVHPQGVLAVVEEPKLALRDVRAPGPILILDGLQDPGNAGTLVRSLHATGGSTVLALKGTVDLFNPKAVRASAGSLFSLEVVARLDVEEALAWLESRGLPLLALEAGGEPLFGPGLTAPERFALAVGNEGAGLSPRLLERAQRRLAIPMARGVDSLNAAVAGSVALYELSRDRVGIDRRPSLS
jgi:TrmH family RNA methyltransferase